MVDKDEAFRHERTFAQAFNLTLPPTHKQFATERVPARIKEREAGKKLRRPGPTLS